MTNLTQRETEFLQTFLESNGCAASNASDLLEDNYSCQCLEELKEIYPKLSKNQIGGFLSSLQEKDILWLEPRDGAICKSDNRIKQMNFAPDLYWVNDTFLEEIKDLKDFNLKDK